MSNSAEDQRGNNEKLPGGVTGKGFPPGVSGNPGGRPKGRSLRALLREALDEDYEDGKSNGRKLIEVLLEAALKDKSLGAIRDVFEQAEGKVPPAEPMPDEEKPKRILIPGADDRHRKDHPR